ncbi:deoxyribose-phosphate aldolase [Falsigemmobacter faecalis]|uniref:Deoxyribose-phosphate aldolase n=1 Tax=Falsigemmobacter faecalis TaxID=2488730 RepID=A0A3P3DG20_9RHOB|nr:deoxyribose-phosphate aldolase [Falsigemmobacter faecalis]RRH72482.1 deoxyribose-phosphate aldolase [Falsigemmobacter faecalis]
MAERNQGMAFEPSLFLSREINRPAAGRAGAAIPSRRALKGLHQAAWLVNAVRCLDLTTLAGDDTAGRVQRLCAKARDPLGPDLSEALGVAVTVGAVCVFPTMVPHAVKALEGSGIPVASVATGFPAGLTPLPLRLAEIRYAVDQGAAEIDIVITRELALTGNWAALYDEIAQMRAACGAAHLKVILATGDLRSLTSVYHSSMVAMQAGADFIKTSTGKEEANATLPVSLVMLRAIRDYQAQTGQIVGFKPAGGLRTAKDALNWQVLMKEELGLPWLRPDLFRIGASSLLADIERQLSHYVTGRYAAFQHHQPA